MAKYFLSGESESRISVLIGLDLSAVAYEYQNWDIELADPDYVEKILRVLPSLKDYEDALAAFAMLISSYDDYIAQKGRDESVENDIRAIVTERSDLFKPVIKYWARVNGYPLSDANYPQEDCWSVTPLMRDLLQSACSIVPRTKIYVLSQKSTTFVTSLLGMNVKRDYSYVDWNRSVGKPEYVEKILKFFSDLRHPDDILAAFALLIASYNKSILETYLREKANHLSLEDCRDEEIENAIFEIVGSHPECCKDVLDYWSNIDYWPLDVPNSPDGTNYAVTGFARDLLKTFDLTS